MSETRRDRALFAAALRALPGKDRTILTTEAIDDICAEYLRLEALIASYGAIEAGKRLTMEEAHRAMAVTKPLPPFGGGKR